MYRRLNKENEIYNNCRNKKVWNDLNKGYFGIVLDAKLNIWWIEKSFLDKAVPEYVFNYIKRYMTKNYKAKYYL